MLKYLDQTSGGVYNIPRDGYIVIHVNTIASCIYLSESTIHHTREYLHRGFRMVSNVFYNRLGITLEEACILRRVGCEDVIFLVNNTVGFISTVRRPGKRPLFFCLTKTFSGNGEVKYNVSLDFPSNTCKFLEKINALV